MASSPPGKALAAKHTASLQLLCTAGGNQARLDARNEFGRAHHCRILRQGLEEGRGEDTSI